ncbi:MAG: ERCC4 domain-containing protein [Gemmatimonadales bacterium]|nr:ERCC4 domain-containing protein [Gemmatimonadales bacterium]
MEDEARSTPPGDLWVVTRSTRGRFPFRILITRHGRPTFAVRAQSAWPGPGQQVFCLRDHAPEAPDDGTEVERAPILGLTRIGRKLAVVLDRPTRKRAEFLLVTKERADGSSFEQLFFRTESGIRAHRSRARVELLTRPSLQGTVLIDSGEKYPWSFPGATTLRRRLAVGDYALLQGISIAAVVERKSFDNLLADLGAVQALHQVFADLGSVGRAAVVVEAEYGDFVDPKRLAGRWPAAHVARVLAELAAVHPRLPIVFAGNRKLANAWTVQFFDAADRARHAEGTPQLSLIGEPRPTDYSTGRPTSVDEQVRTAALAMGFAFSLRELGDRCPECSAPRLRRIMTHLAAEGAIRRVGRGRGTRWEVVRG